MADIAAIYHWSDGDTITAARLNTTEGIVTTVNADFFQKNKASQTITVAFTVSAAVTISSGGIAVTGNSTITGTLTALTGITSSGTAALGTVTASATITAGTGLTVTAGGATITAGNLTMSGGQAIAYRTDGGNAGASQTIDFDVSQIRRLKLNAANCTITLSNGRTGATYYVELMQDATGSRTVTWPATVDWGTGGAPTLTTTASRKDMFGFYYNGFKYVGSVLALGLNDGDTG